jgi:hypothetical protein
VIRRLAKISRPVVAELTHIESARSHWQRPQTKSAHMARTPVQHKAVFLATHWSSSRSPRPGRPYGPSHAVRLRRTLDPALTWVGGLRGSRQEQATARTAGGWQSEPRSGGYARLFVARLVSGLQTHGHEHARDPLRAQRGCHGRLPGAGRGTVRCGLRAGFCLPRGVAMGGSGPGRLAARCCRACAGDCVRQAGHGPVRPDRGRANTGGAKRRYPGGDGRGRI